MTMKIGKIVLCIVSVFLSSMAAQTKADKASSIDTDTEPEGLVLLPVQAQDGDGKPVRGLTANDFTLKIDGKPESIKVFLEVTGNAPYAAPVQSHTPSSSSVSRIYSSVPEGGMPQQLLIVAIDLVNTGFIGKGEAQQQLLTYLTVDLPEQPFELVAITAEGLVQIHSFSEVSPSSAEGAAERALSATEYSTLLKLIQAPRTRSLFSWEIAARASLTALRQLAEAYAAVPGRKTVIWLTAGIRAMGGDPNATARRRGSVQVYDKSPLATDPQLRATYDEAFRALNTADMAVYPLDLKPAPGGKIYLANLMGPAIDNGSGLTFTVGGFETNDGIKPLAAESGGRPCSIANELRLCVDQALNDARSYYLLGFYVRPREQKSGWHKLDLSTPSSAYKVRTRSRFFIPTSPAAGSEEVRQYLMTAARGNTKYSGLGFSVERLPNSPPPADDPINVRIRVPASSVLLQPGETKLSYEIAMVGLSRTGEAMNAVRIIPFDLTPDQTQAALLKGWRIDESWPDIESMALLRYVIRDKGTGRVGSVTIPLQTAGPK
jgi:VWFA-related protein